MLKTTNIKLVLMKDIDMFLFIEKVCVVESVIFLTDMENKS